MTTRSLFRSGFCIVVSFLFAAQVWAGEQDSGNTYHQAFEQASPVARVADLRSNASPSFDLNQSRQHADFQLSNTAAASSDCGNMDDWDHDFYDCCRKSRFDFDEICDPCCNKPYISVFGGGTTVENFFRDITTLASPLTVESQGANLVDGYGIGAAIGYRVHNYLRMEAEYSYRFNKVENWFTGVSIDGVPSTLTPEAATGRVYSHAGMFNIIADLSQRRVRCFNLHAGAGLGILTIDAQIATATDNYISDDSQFAYQLIGGVTYPWSERLEFFTEYRYLASQGLDVVDAATNTNFGDFDYDSHNLFFGLRFNR